jgi:hypothetical protein
MFKVCVTPKRVQIDIFMIFRFKNYRFKKQSKLQSQVFLNDNNDIKLLAVCHLRYKV